MKFILQLNKSQLWRINIFSVIIQILSNLRERIISFSHLYFFLLVLLLIKVSFQLLISLLCFLYLFPEPLSQICCFSSYSYWSFHNPNLLISQDHFLLNLPQITLSFHHFLYLKILLVLAQPTISSFLSSRAFFYPYRKELLTS